MQIGSSDIGNIARRYPLRLAGLVGICISLSAAGPSAHDTRQIWKGEFHQTAPIPWSGAIELYLRYNSEADPPQALDGILRWPSLGDARVRIEGEHKADGSIEFVEKECLAGDCSRVILGGRHKLMLQKQSGTFSGKAEGRLGSGFHGSYTLKQ